MTQIEVKLKPWYQDLCEYYDVTPEQALVLGTRSSGRKPDLPGSATCDPVSEMTHEDIWESRERNSLQDVFDFYKDQGAWSAFRQCVRHKDLVELHLNFTAPFIGAHDHVCEYGSGAAPYMNTLLQAIDPNAALDISIADVDCEHFTFAQWRLNKLKSDRNMQNVNIHAHEVVVDALPKFHRNLDLVTIFEVLEHTPDPVAVIKNLHGQMNDECILVENFILAPDVLAGEEFEGPDLKSAALMRDDYLSFVSDNFDLIADQGGNPNATRIWRKK